MKKDVAVSAKKCPAFKRKGKREADAWNHSGAPAQLPQAVPLAQLLSLDEHALFWGRLGLCARQVLADHSLESYVTWDHGPEGWKAPPMWENLRSLIPLH